jgi:hypothetical protein
MPRRFVDGRFRVESGHCAIGLSVKYAFCTVAVEPEPLKKQKVAIEKNILLAQAEIAKLRKQAGPPKAPTR